MLAGFLSEAGYRKDDPKKEIRLSPRNTGFHKYYYSQPLPDGGYDHDRLENYFCESETKWPGIVEKFRAGESRFAYEAVYADRAGFNGHVGKFADVSPVIRTETIPAPSGQYIMHQFVWGQRTRKPKWQPNNQ